MPNLLFELIIISAWSSLIKNFPSMPEQSSQKGAVTIAVERQKPIKNDALTEAWFNLTVRLFNMLFER